jgi:hypothetical protein
MEIRNDLPRLRFVRHESEHLGSGDTFLNHRQEPRTGISDDEAAPMKVRGLAAASLLTVTARALRIEDSRAVADGVSGSAGAILTRLGLEGEPGTVCDNDRQRNAHVLIIVA